MKLTETFIHAMEVKGEILDCGKYGRRYNSQGWGGA